MTQQYRGLLKCLISFLMLMQLTGNPLLAEDVDNMELKIKAAYLYNFTKFINWPEDASPTFNLCVIGETPLNSVLMSLENKTAFDKPIRILVVDNVNELSLCHIAYFEHLIKRDSDSLHSPPLAKALTVSNQADFTRQGGMIEFVLENEKVKLLVNLKAIKRQGLTMSAKLIEVATLVEE